MNVKWSIKNGKKYLHFLFDEYLNKDQAQKLIQDWEKLTVNHSDKICLIWDCSKMEGYDPDARKLWQDKLKKIKSSIETIWLISNSNIIKMGASIMSMFMPFKIKNVSSENEIK